MLRSNNHRVKGMISSPYLKMKVSFGHITES
jgi:hypothetical protein